MKQQLLIQQLEHPQLQPQPLLPPQLQPVPQLQQTNQEILFVQVSFFI